MASPIENFETELSNILNRSAATHMFDVRPLVRAAVTGPGNVTRSQIEHYRVRLDQLSRFCENARSLDGTLLRVLEEGKECPPEDMIEWVDSYSAKQWKIRNYFDSCWMSNNDSGLARALACMEDLNSEIRKESDMDFTDLDTDVAEVEPKIEVQTEKQENHVGEYELNDFFGFTELKQNLNAIDEVSDNFIDLDNDMDVIEVEQVVKILTLDGHVDKVKIRNRKNFFYLNRPNLNAQRRSNNVSTRARYRTFVHNVMNKRNVEVYGEIIDNPMVTMRDGLPWYVRRKRVRFRG